MALPTEQVVGFIKKNPIGVGCAALCIVLGALIFVRGNKIPDAKVDLEQKSDKAQLYKNNRENAKDLSEQYDELVADNKAIDGRMVRVSQNLQNPRYFYELKSDTGVDLDTPNQLTSAANVKSATKGSFVYVGFSLSLRGTYPQVLSYLRKLENGPHFCRVLTCSIAKPGGENADLVTLNLSLELLGQP